MSNLFWAKTTIAFIGIGSVCVGFWGIYESSKTVKQNLIKQGEEIRNNYDFKSPQETNNLKEFIGENESNNNVAWKKACEFTLNIRRWSLRYPKAIEDAKKFCTKTK